MSMELRGMTICAVRKNGHTSIAGDGQVTMGAVIFKSHARRVRRLYGGQVVIGFAGAVADAFTLCDKFEEKLTQCGGNPRTRGGLRWRQMGAAIPNASGLKRR